MNRNQYLKIVDAQGNPIPKYSIYEAAGSGRRMSTWGTTSYGPNTLLNASLRTIRARTHQLVRNNPLAKNSVETWVSNLVGTGIVPQWNIENQVLKKEIQDLFNYWCIEADADGICDFFGLQSLAASGLVEAGEVFAQFKIRRKSKGLSVPLQIQLLEAEYLDETFEGVAENGNKIRMGIEFDRNNHRVAYHFYKDHPGENYWFSNSSDRIRVPASEVLHVFRPVRPGQARGVPWLTSVIVKLYEFDKYDDAELVRKLGAALIGGFIKEPPGESVEISPLGKKKNDDSQGRDVIAMEPGTFPVLPPGMEVEFSNPADVGGNYLAWVKQQLHEIAAGAGITYEQLTGDLSDVNYSSIRAGLIEFRRRCEILQWNNIIFQLCDPITRYWLDIAVASGVVRIPDYYVNRRKYLDINWHPQGWSWVDPLKDVLAAQLAVRCGFTSRSAVVAGQGYDSESIDREQVVDNARADASGLIYDSDSRKTEKSGTLQKAEDIALLEEK